GVENRASRPLSRTQAPCYAQPILNAPSAPKRHSRERLARAISHGFICEYQTEKEKEGNTICHCELAPATLEKYDSTVCNQITSFISKWERETSRSLPKEIKEDVLNPRERFLVNGKDIDYLLQRLFIDNCHDYIHERVIVYRVADSAFKGLATIIEVLTVKLPKGREIRGGIINKIDWILYLNGLIFIDTLYAEYVSRNNFSERDSIPLFDIYKKYLPERARLSENLLKEVTLDSEIGRQYLEDIVTIYTSTEHAIYYPSIAPEEGRCPIYNKSILELKD
ncbi:uncharacterized protein N7518_009136, partial [Penicillium psychrosexuale]|uniref:uncharacterized protein n=1 Tax=Penicillium psychrosexuale TaxID=1002107 RepID=UPI002545BA98